MIAGDAAINITAPTDDSPFFFHMLRLRDVFDRGVHVLLEKPMCTTIEDSHELVRRAENHPAVVWVGLEYRYMAPIARLLDEVRTRLVATGEEPSPAAVATWRSGCSRRGTRRNR